LSAFDRYQEKKKEKKRVKKIRSKEEKAEKKKMSKMSETEINALEQEKQRNRDALSMLVAKKDEPSNQLESVTDDRFSNHLKGKDYARDPTHKDYKKDERPLKRPPQKRFKK
jgi:predicted  nucleic acid-binding Zn-ribbon protein